MKRTRAHRNADAADMLQSVCTSLQLIEPLLAIGLAVVKNSRGKWCIALHRENDDGEMVTEYPNVSQQIEAALEFFMALAAWKDEADASIDELMRIAP
jgi:hypothetical protein